MRRSADKVCVFQMKPGPAHTLNIGRRKPVPKLITMTGISHSPVIHDADSDSAGSGDPNTSEDQASGEKGKQPKRWMMNKQKPTFKASEMKSVKIEPPTQVPVGAKLDKDRRVGKGVRRQTVAIPATPPSQPRKTRSSTVDVAKAPALIRGTRARTPTAKKREMEDRDVATQATPKRARLATPGPSTPSRLQPKRQSKKGHAL
jgi:hypothetical protein